MNFDGKVEFDFKPKTVDIQPIKISTIEDFIAMSNEPSIKQEFEAFKAKYGISYDVENKKLMINGQEASREELVQLIGLVNKFISENKAIANTKIADVKDHFVQRKRALAKNISNDSVGGKMNVSLWPRNPKHDLFQGHYCQCCVSLDGINKHSIVQTLAHTVDQIAELKDASGNTVGKVKM